MLISNLKDNGQWKSVVIVGIFQGKNNKFDSFWTTTMLAFNYFLENITALKHNILKTWIQAWVYHKCCLGKRSATVTQELIAGLKNT